MSNDEENRIRREEATRIADAIEKADTAKEIGAQFGPSAGLGAKLALEIVVDFLRRAADLERRAVTP